MMVFATTKTQMKFLNNNLKCIIGLINFEHHSEVIQIKEPSECWKRDTRDMKLTTLF